MREALSKASRSIFDFRVPAPPKDDTFELFIWRCRKKDRIVQGLDAPTAVTPEDSVAIGKALRRYA